MRNFHVEVGPRDGFLVETEDVYIPPYVEQGRRWGRFVEQLNQARPLLNRLVIMDRYTCYPAWSIYSNYGYVHAPIDPSVLEDKIMVIIQLVEPVKFRVENLTVVIRSAYIWTQYVSIGDSPHIVLRSCAVPPAPTRSHG